jgi:hypothetical protein
MRHERAYGEHRSEILAELSKLALGWVNDIRREHHIGQALVCLPPGRVRDAEECVVARAVHRGHCLAEDGLLTLFSRTDEHGDSWLTGLPPSVTRFLEAFDQGDYPLLAGD